MSVENKVAVITGAGNGIGRALALAFGTGGARVVVNDLGVPVGGGTASSAAADAVVAEIRAAGGQAVASSDSVASMAGGRQIIQCALDHFGRVDHVSTCAGILRPASIFDITEEDWDQVIATNLKGHFAVIQPAARQMREQQSGSILTYTSTGGLEGSPNQPNYAAAKEGILGLMRSVALSVAPYASCNALSPGAQTRMIDLMRPGHHSDELPEHIAPVALFLASDAAKHITGQVIRAAGYKIGVYPQPRPVRQLTAQQPWSQQSLEAAWEGALGQEKLLRYDRFAGNVK